MFLTKMRITLINNIIKRQEDWLAVFFCFFKNDIKMKNLGPLS